MNLKVRIKNPWFWIGLVGVALTAIGVDPTTAGIKDSARAMLYKAPAKDKEAK